jgi:hypothetical protein
MVFLGVQKALLEEAAMNLSMQQIIDSFELLPDSEKQKVAFEILRRSVHLEVPPLTDEDLIAAAEDLFLTLDALEAENGPSKQGRGLVS